jgi:2-methylcitrate dehydratase PrpD
VSDNVTVGSEVTRRLAKYIVKAEPGDLPAAVKKEGLRTLLNYVGCAVGGAKHEAVDIAVKALTPFSGLAHASLFGRAERFDIMHAAFINGLSSHVLDFDDTHLKTVIHPGGPVCSAILAYAEQFKVTGEEFLNALILGVEAECRIGNSVYPDHYDRGWHITGSTGVFGAAAAVGKLMKLDEQQMVYALGVAASQPVGLREMFGTMTKPFNPGRAAQNGLFAAFLAQGGFTSSNQPLEAKRGWCNVLSTKQDYSEITDGLGDHFEISINTYKPFACGIVIHPAIDGCAQLSAQHNLTAEDVAKVELKVHPLVLELTGKKTPQTGLEGKFSVYQSCAMAIIDRTAGERQYSDENVRNARVIALRDKVDAVVDKSIHEHQADCTITTKDGRKLHLFVENAIGSLGRPMTDKDLEDKFVGLADGILEPPRTKALIDLCWKTEELKDVAVIAQSGRAA